MYISQKKSVRLSYDPCVTTFFALLKVQEKRVVEGVTSLLRVQIAAYPAKEVLKELKIASRTRKIQLDIIKFSSKTV